MNSKINDNKQDYPPPKRLKDFTSSPFTDSSSLLGSYGVPPCPIDLVLDLLLSCLSQIKRQKMEQILLFVDLGKRPTSIHERT